MPIETPRPQGREPRGRSGDLGRRLAIVGAVAGVIVLAVVATGLIARSKSASDTKTWTKAREVPAVSVIHPQVDRGAQDLVLPGALQAYYNAQIFSRVPGYVAAWYTDIGAKVAKGQVLAKIDTPELDQQLIQARADLNSAEANMELARTTANRWKSLLTQDAVSKQETEEKAGDYLVRTALVSAAKANVDRLLALKGFARITAPFDGYVTARKTDIGALVNAGAGASADSELFDVGEVDKLRLYVRVPQSYSAQIVPGIKVSISVPERPGETFPATLLSTSNAVNVSSGTLLAEFLVTNPQGLLKAGDYAEVVFKLPNVGAVGADKLRLPSSALLFLRSGLEAAVVGADNHVHLRRVVVGRDLGTEMEIASGLSPKDEVVNNPPDSLADGELVRVIPSDGEPAAVPERN
jgi:RND family efflux transporter MFP subunit